jgi:hypothetical protein
MPIWPAVGGILPLISASIQHPLQMFPFRLF